MVKHIRKHKKEQIVAVLLIIYIKGDDLATSVIYHMTEEDWAEIDWQPKTLGELRRWYNQKPLLRGIKYLGYDVNGIECHWDNGELEIFQIEKIEHNGI